MLAIIGVLVGLMLPAVQQARSSARRLQCVNNLRNIGLAMLAEANTKRRFPASGNFAYSSTAPGVVGKMSCSAWTVISSSASAAIARRAASAA